jgi:hypothetical protein
LIAFQIKTPGSHCWLPGFEFELVGLAVSYGLRRARSDAPYLYLLPARLGQRVAARVNGVLAELLLDAQELVVFRQTIGTAE